MIKTKDMKFTLHNKSGDYMEVQSRSLKVAKEKCDLASYDCIVCEEKVLPSPFDNSKLTKHGVEVYRNF
jgi:hypothetical protein